MTQAPSGPPSLECRLASGDNALNAIRLLLASLVIVGHSFPLGAFSAPRFFSDIHGTAVNGFFAISGYLILGSGLRLKTGTFLWRRFLRIYPGYLVAIVACAFVFAPIGAGLDRADVWHANSAVQFVLRGLDLAPEQGGIADTLRAVPYPEVWNGSLWTLAYEFGAYLAVALLALFPQFRRRPTAATLAIALILLGAWGIASTGTLKARLGPDLGFVATNGARLAAYFAAGMALRVVADRVRLRWTLVGAALAAYVVITELLPELGAPARLVAVLAVPALAYGLLGAGGLAATRIGARNDVSYGMYVYAFPVQQLLVVAGVAQFGWFITMLSAVALTVPCALLSWFVIEKPCLGLKQALRTRVWDLPSASHAAGPPELSEPQNGR